jgi:nucleoside phosphorylase
MPDVDLLILSAMADELEPGLGPLGPATGPVQAPSPAEVRAYQVRGRRVVAGWTGMGAQATRRALEALVALRPRCVLHIGCAGALDPGLDSGDVIVVERTRSGATSLDVEPSPRVATAAAGGASGAGTVHATVTGALTRWRRGSAVMVDKLVGDVAGKRALRESSGGADVVEMESHAVSEVARRERLDLVCVRVVIDRADEELPDLTEGLDAVGRPRPLKMALVIARRPGAAARLPRLAKAFGAAQASMAQVVRDVVAAL